jgi:nicotinamidase-related amidase
MKKPVLIVIDMLNDFLDQWEPTARNRLTQSINELIGVVRGSGNPIIWVRQEFDPDLHDAFPEMRAKSIRSTIKGTRGSELVPELQPFPGETVIVKKRYSAFYRTNLDEALGRLLPSELILAGINTHACIRMTAIDAYQRDWPVVLATDCVDSYDRQHHEISVKYMAGKIATVLSNQEIRRALGAE